MVDDSFDAVQFLWWRLSKHFLGAVASVHGVLVQVNIQYWKTSPSCEYLLKVAVWEATTGTPVTKVFSCVLEPDSSFDRVIGRTATLWLTNELRTDVFRAYGVRGTSRQLHPSSYTAIYAIGTTNPVTESRAWTITLHTDWDWVRSQVLQSVIVRARSDLTTFSSCPKSLIMAVLCSILEEKTTPL